MFRAPGAETVRRMRTSLIVVPLLMVACAEPPREPLTPLPDVCEGTAPRAVDFRTQVQPVIEAKCASCHRTGGPGPFQLETPQQMKTMAGAMRSSVCRRSMPPWQAHRDCNTYVGDFSLTDEQILLIRDWIDSGADITGAVTNPLTNPAGLSRVDLELKLPEPYRPMGAPDDYRCFVIDINNQSDRFVTGFGMAPDQTALVHHVVLFIVDPANAGLYTNADSAFEGPGYPCFGGPMPSTGEGDQAAPGGIPSMIGAWAPGSAGKDLPAGTGIRLPPGSKVVVQMHYNVQNFTPGFDQSRVMLKLDETVEREAFNVPFLNPSWVREAAMPIPAGAKDAYHVFRAPADLAIARLTRDAMPAGKPFEVHGGSLHMHTRGTWAQFSVEKGNQSSCVNYIPEWDFNWQGSFFLEKPTRVEAGDELRMECHWNNEGPTARDRNWGEGTEDEMCLGFIYVTPVK
jgi:hypothetical protein